MEMSIYTLKSNSYSGILKRHRSGMHGFLCYGLLLSASWFGCYVVARKNKGLSQLRLSP
jgi:hypothetical protein